jgi:hypothetical protein
MPITGHMAGIAIEARRIAANVAELVGKLHAESMPLYFLAGSSTFPDFGLTR